LLVQRGTLRVGDIVVAGAEWGRVRALSDDRGRSLDEAGPAQPVEVLGLTGVPAAGDEFAVVENTFVQRFPLYAAGDTNAKPTGKMRQLQYKLRQGEAGWVLRLDRVVEY